MDTGSPISIMNKELLQDIADDNTELDNRHIKPTEGNRTLISKRNVMD